MTRFLNKAAFTVATALFAVTISMPAKAETSVGKMQTVITKYEDTLLDIARKNNLGYVEMRAANPDVDPWLPGEGTKITLPNWHLFPEARQEGIVVNLAEMRMYIFQEGKEPKTFPIGIGRDGFETPTGETTVSWKRANPPWRPTPDMIKANPNLPKEVPPGPDNPLGTHAVYLGWTNYLMHGTSKPWGIGRRVSSGCMRMYPEDIKKVYALAEKNMLVQVVNQPIKMGWYENDLYIEASPAIDAINDFEHDGYSDGYDVDKGFLKKLHKLVGDDFSKMDWDKIRNILKERRGYPIKVYEKPQEASFSDKLLS